MLKDRTSNCVSSVRSGGYTTEKEKEGDGEGKKMRGEMRGKRGKEGKGKGKKPNAKGKYEGKKLDLWKKCTSFANAAKTKYQENQKGVDRLESEGKITKPVKVRNFYGHETSISQQVRLIESINL